MKINVLSMGSCLAKDILKCHPMYFDLYNVTSYFGSISRPQWEPGKIAFRLQEDLYGQQVRDEWAQRQINYATKLQTPYSLIENLPANTVVLLDYSYEIGNFFFDGNEIFDIAQSYNARVRGEMPQWFNDLVDKNMHGFDSGIKELALFQHHSMLKFAKDLAAKNIPAIMFDNFFTKRVYSPVTNSVAELIPLYNRAMPFRKIKIVGDELEQMEYSERVVGKFYDSIRRNAPSNFKFFTPDLNQIYADINHPFGYHPVHLHRTCREVLVKQLAELINTALAESKAQQLVTSLAE